MIGFSSCKEIRFACCFASNLSNAGNAPCRRGMAGKGELKNMDLIDAKILSLLEENARIPLKKIAEQVFLSAPAVSARIERLEKAGIITGYRAVIDQRRLGYHIAAFVNVVLSPERQKPFFSFIEGCRNVTECYHVAGPYSMLMKVNFPDTQQLDTFVAKVQKFGKTQTQIVFSTVVEPREVDFSVKG